MKLQKAKQAKKDAYRTGMKAEALCRLALRLKFYRIIASRYRSPFGEIDIVAARGKTLVLIEVKARASKRQAIEAVTQHQRDRLARGASDFLARNPRYHKHDIRFDVMLVAKTRWPVHIRGAWRL